MARVILNLVFSTAYGSTILFYKQSLTWNKYEYKNKRSDGERFAVFVSNEGAKTTVTFEIKPSVILGIW